MSNDGTAAAVATAPPAKKFGTFLGVYTPSVLTILGVMMYLRFGWVLGNVGLPIALLIVLMASSITFVTGLSASAIATNMHVGVGGEYFMVSRSLGLELGGAIGIPLFLCRTLSLTLYAFGLAESVAFLWPDAWGAAPVQWIAAGSIVLITAIAGKSAEASLKLQLPIMVAVGASVLALILGVISGDLTSPEMAPHYERSAPAGFWYVFAVFFPAVTGFTAGIGMSGDLEDPKRSIPKGTILAVLTGVIVYLTIPFVLGITARVTPGELSVLDPGAPPIWTRVALLGAWLVFPGMWGAILSSAFGSALGGPRVLQALANDGLAPRFLARTSKTGQPTISTWATGAIALAAVMLGNLNEVGRWVTIFFLTLYVMLNLSAALEKLVGDPSYRPTIKVPWFVSLLGSAGAILVMFLISPAACVTAVSLEFILYMGLRRRALKSSWGDVRAGFWTTAAKYSLMRLRTYARQARSWRPHILLFTANPKSRLGMVRLASWFNQNRGVTTICQVVPGELAEVDFDPSQRRREMEASLEQDGLVVFSEVAVVPEFEAGVISIAQTNGFAGLQSNTLMFGWPGSREGLERILRVMRAMSRVHTSVILAKLARAEGPRGRGHVDIWWRGKQANGDMMLMLAYLVSLNPDWRRAVITVRTIVEDDEARDPMRARIQQMLTEARLTAEIDVIANIPGQDLISVMHVASRDADLVFLGLMLPGPDQDAAYAERLETLAVGFRNTVLVRNAGPFQGELI
jgi:amino acid transporter